MKRLIPLLCLLLCLPVVAAGQSSPSGDLERRISVYDDPARDEWQKPLTVLDFLGVEPGDTVADLGAGTGYFTRFLSRQVAEPGKVYAVDIEQEMLDYLMTREDVTEERVIPVLAEPDDPGLPDGEIDIVVVMNTWHHIKKRSKYLRLLQESLSPEGRIAIVDYREGDLPVGPRASQKLSRDRVVSEFEKEDWRFVAESVALSYQYVLIFLPPEKPDTRKFISH
jgi:ubiquinone/menaquinone biosynthesis C-methylase UbiE